MVIQQEDIYWVALTRPRIDQSLAGIQFVERLTKPGETGGGKS
jgi:hypothetical protein